jgi:hypothetical protein
MLGLTMVFKDSERSVASDIKEKINNIIKKKKLPLGEAKVEQIDSKGHQPDIIIYNNMKQPFCTIEIKRPFIAPYQVGLFEQAHGYAETEGLDYFASFNCNTLILWKTFVKDVPLLNRRYKEYRILRIKKLEELEKTANKKALLVGLEQFLLDLTALLTKRPEEILPSLKLDEIFINYLHSLIDSMHIPLSESLLSRYEVEPLFRREIHDWFTEQCWNFTTSEDATERLSRQYILLFINKIMFYDIIKANYSKIRPENYTMMKLPGELPKLKIPEDIDDGGILNKFLEGYFEKVLKIDYQTIYKTSFLEEIELPQELIPHIRNLASEFDKYDFTYIDYEVLGNIFESLIPPEDRHKFGQYFTRSDVVDLIVANCVRTKNDIILDPACGAGTFLIRSYSRLKYLGMKGEHRDYIERLWGIDIAKFPAHLTTINIIIKDLSERFNFPRIARDDFFSVLPNTKISETSFAIESMKSAGVDSDLPKFNAVITNPPYTRQEEMEEKTGTGYKDKIIDLIRRESEITVGKRSSIYSYFFFHGVPFLDKSGRLGLITSNSWLDVDYGKYLQQFFLENFKIKMIIESKVERFFSDADVNTCITILEKCKAEEERNDNIIKFVELRKNLPDILKSFVNDGEEYNEWNDEKRWGATDGFIKWIHEKDKFIIDEKIGLRVFPKKQSELWDEGFDTEEKKFEGAKWGKYLRAPDIFFEIMEKGQDIFTPLKEIADVKRGFTTGANEFFYLRKEDIKRWGIEREYWMHKKGKKWIPNYIIKSPRECKKIIIKPEDLQHRVFIVHKDKDKLKDTNVLKYIEWGEEQEFHKRPTCASRKNWYDLGTQEFADFIWFKAFNDRVISPDLNREFPNSDRLYNIRIKKENNQIKTILGAILNSTLQHFIVELWGRVNLGEGALDNMTYEAASMLILNPTKIKKNILKKIETIINKFYKRPINSIFEELGTENPDELTLDKVKKDRRGLDKIIMGDILGLTDDEQLVVYKAVIDLVQSRIERAKSAKNKKKNNQKFKANIEQLSIVAFHEVFLDYLRLNKELELGEVKKQEISSEIKGDIKVEVDITGKPKVVINGEELKCDSVEEAKYIKYNLLMGESEIKIPLDGQILSKAVRNFDRIKREINKGLKKTLDTCVKDEKIQDRIKDKIYKEMWLKVGMFEV